MNSLVSKIQLKWVQKVWAHQLSRYSPRKYAEIQRVQRETFAMIELRSLLIFSYGQRIQISKGSRVYTMPGKSKAQPQLTRADFRTFQPPSQCSFIAWHKALCSFFLLRAHAQGSPGPSLRGTLAQGVKCTNQCT